jgi:hypothetical protein
MEASMKRVFLGLLTAVLLMTGIAVAQSPADSSNPNANQNTQRTDDNHHDYGWVGLIGLAGLAGLAGRKRDRTVDTRTGTSR